MTFDLTTSLRPRASSHTQHTAAREAGLWLPRLVCQVGLFVFSGCDFPPVVPNPRNLRAESCFAMRLQGQFPRGAQALSTPPRFTTKCEHIAYGGSPHSLGVRRSWHVKSSSSEPQPVQEQASQGGGLTAPPGAGRVETCKAAGVRPRNRPLTFALS